MSDGALQRTLEEIAQRNGGVLKPEHVLVEAANPSHPLHDRFEWDDARAGHAYRIDQARTLIRSVKVSVVVESRKIESVFYVRDPSQPTNETGYISVPRLRSDKELAAEAIKAEFARARAIMVRARDLAVVLGVEEDVDMLLGHLQRLADDVPQIAAAG